MSNFTAVVLARALNEMCPSKKRKAEDDTFLVTLNKRREGGLFKGKWEAGEMDFSIALLGAFVRGGLDGCADNEYFLKYLANVLCRPYQCVKDKVTRKEEGEDYGPLGKFYRPHYNYVKGDGALVNADDVARTIKLPIIQQELGTTESVTKKAKTNSQSLIKQQQQQIEQQQQEIDRCRQQIEQQRLRIEQLSNLHAAGSPSQQDTSQHCHLGYNQAFVFHPVIGSSSSSSSLDSLEDEAIALFPVLWAAGSDYIRRRSDIRAQLKIFNVYVVVLMLLAAAKKAKRKEKVIYCSSSCCRTSSSRICDGAMCPSFVSRSGALSSWMYGKGRGKVLR